MATHSGVANPTAGVYTFGMSKERILDEISKLSSEERQEIRARLAEIDGEEWLDDGALSSREKALIEERFRDLRENPQTSIPWEEAKAELLSLVNR
jgi:hypothetical protein